MAEDFAALATVVTSARKGEVVLAEKARLDLGVLHPVGRVQAIPIGVLFLLGRGVARRGACLLGGHHSITGFFGGGGRRTAAL